MSKMMSGEIFVGGFAGGFLARGLRIGYGIYFTTDRIIGVDLSKGTARFLGGSMAGSVEGQLMPKLPQEESDKVITELDQAKEFEMAKGQIANIEIKKPGLLGGGHLLLTKVNGEKVEINLRHVIAYGRLVELTRAFRPEIVSLR